MEDTKRLSIAAALRGLGLGPNLVDVAEILWDAARGEPGYEAIAYTAVLRHQLGRDPRCIRRWLAELAAEGVITIVHRERHYGAYRYRMADPLARFRVHHEIAGAEEQLLLGEAPPATIRFDCADMVSARPESNGHDVRLDCPRDLSQADMVSACNISDPPTLTNCDSARGVRRAGSRARISALAEIQTSSSSSSSSSSPLLSYPPHARDWMRAFALQLQRDVNELVPERPVDPRQVDPRPNAYGRLHASVAERFAAAVWEWAIRERASAKARGEQPAKRFGDPTELRTAMDQLRGQWRAKLKNALAVPGMVRQGAVLYWFGIVEQEYIEPHGLKFSFGRARAPARGEG